MFTPNILNDSSNQFTRLVQIDPASGLTNTTQDYWNTSNPSLEGSDIAQTNFESIHNILYHTVNANMSSLDLVPKFICEFLTQTKCFRIYLGPYTLDKKGLTVFTTYPKK